MEIPQNEDHCIVEEGSKADWQEDEVPGTLAVYFSAGSVQFKKSAE